MGLSAEENKLKSYYASRPVFFCLKNHVHNALQKIQVLQFKLLLPILQSYEVKTAELYRIIVHYSKNSILHIVIMGGGGK